MNSKRIVLPALIAVLLSPVVRASVDVDIFAQIRLGQAPPPPPPEVIVVEPVGPLGPPPWPASRWFHRSHAYYYYTDSEVYYRPDDRMWFYVEGGNWRAAAQLPAGIPIDFSHNVALTLATEQPYAYHHEVVAYYPANYFTKVKFKNGHDNRPDHDDRDDHDNRGGKGRGRGKRD